MDKRYYIAHYEGSTAYEPAEGGYYVSELLLDNVSEKSYSLKHARREFLKAIKEYSECFGKPDYINHYKAHWTTGKHIGDEFEVRMTTDPMYHEDRYTGYC